MERAHRDDLRRLVLTTKHKQPAIAQDTKIKTRQRFTFRLLTLLIVREAYLKHREHLPTYHVFNNNALNNGPAQEIKETTLQPNRRDGSTAIIKHIIRRTHTISNHNSLHSFMMMHSIWSGVLPYLEFRILNKKLILTSREPQLNNELKHRNNGA